MWYREANLIPPKSPHICSFSLELWNADRECKQDSGTHEHYHNADLREGNKHKTRTRYINV